MRLILAAGIAAGLVYASTAQTKDWRATADNWSCFLTGRPALPAMGAHCPTPEEKAFWESLRADARRKATEAHDKLVSDCIYQRWMQGSDTKDLAKVRCEREFPPVKFNSGE
jgi:hypothetical protein